MHILAIDAGFASCGWAVLRGGKIVKVGCIRTARCDKKRAIRVSDDDTERCRVLSRQLAQIVKAHSVAGIVVEMPTGGGKASRAVSCMARASAVVASVAELCGVPLEVVTPLEVKQVAGARDSSKADVEAIVLKRWPGADLPKIKAEREHIADALAAYIAAEHGNLCRVLNSATFHTQEGLQHK